MTYDLDPVECVLRDPRSCRLDEIGKRSVRQAVLPLFLDRQHLHRNVPGRRIELQVVEHGPAEHVRKEHVERDRRRQVLSRERQRRLPAVGDNALEALVSRKTQEHPRVVRIVVDDQKNVVAVRDLVPVVGHDLFGFRDCEHGQHRLRAASASLPRTHSRAPSPREPGRCR